ncbi:hypothetical protein TKK_0006707 [Trichogramma kaykai]
MGGTRFAHLHSAAREIWQFCEERNIWIFASYISSSNNFEADEESRRVEPETEYSLSDSSFEVIIKRWNRPEIDLFASRSNAKCNRYVSWKRDPSSEAIDAFTLSWANLFFYAFPPFSIILKEFSSNVEKSFPGSREVIGQALLKQGVPEEAIGTSIASIEKSTIKSYETTLKKWWNFAYATQVDFYNTLVQDVIRFLQEQFDKGLSHSALNIARSAISLISYNDIANDKRMKRFLTGIYKRRPAKPKYNYVWDPSVILEYFQSQECNENLNFKDLSQKLITLLALVTGQRIQTLSLIKVANISFQKEKICIFIPDHIKTSRRGTNQPLLHLPYYLEERKICPATTLKYYLKITKDLRGNVDTLFLSLNKKSGICRQTLSKWVKNVFSNAGLDKAFSAHSTRHASTSKAKSLGVNTDVILQTAGWTSNSCFARFYNKDVVASNDQFARAILNHKK